MISSYIRESAERAGIPVPCPDCGGEKRVYMLSEWFPCPQCDPQGYAEQLKQHRVEE